MIIPRFRLPGRRPRRIPPAARGFVLIEMMVTVGLFSIFSVAAVRLISFSLRVTGDVARAEEIHRTFDAGLARLRADAWTAHAIAVGGPGGVTLDLGTAGTVTWNVGADGALARTEARAGAYPERQTWPSAGEHLTFRAEPTALVVEVPTRRGFDNGTYRLSSQILLAREAGR